MNGIFCPKSKEFWVESGEAFDNALEVVVDNLKPFVKVRNRTDTAECIAMLKVIQILRTPVSFGKIDADLDVDGEFGIKICIHDNRAVNVLKDININKCEIISQLIENNIPYVSFGDNKLFVVSNVDEKISNKKLSVFVINSLISGEADIIFDTEMEEYFIIFNFDLTKESFLERLSNITYEERVCTLNEYEYNCDDEEGYEEIYDDEEDYDEEDYDEEEEEEDEDEDEEEFNFNIEEAFNNVDIGGSVFEEEPSVLLSVDSSEDFSEDSSEDSEEQVITNNEEEIKEIVIEKWLIASEEGTFVKEGTPTYLENRYVKPLKVLSSYIVTL